MSRLARLMQRRMPLRFVRRPVEVAASQRLPARTNARKLLFQLQVMLVHRLRDRLHKKYQRALR